MRSYVLMVLLFCLPATAFAQNHEAEALITEGVALRRQQRDVEALERFERAYAIDASPRALAQIALAEHALRHYLRAHDALTRALAATHDSWVRSREIALRDALADTDAHLGRIRVTGGRDGDAVFLDGRQAGALPLSEPIFAEVGRAEVSLRRGERELSTQRVSVEAGQTFTVIFADVPDEPTTQEIVPTTATQTSEQSWRPIVGWTGVGVGAALLGVGAGMHVLREDSAVSYNEHCDMSGAPLDAQTNCDALKSRTRTYEALAITGYVIGGTALVSGVVMLLLPRAHDAQTAEVRCAPMLGSTVGVTCGGNF